MQKHILVVMTNCPPGTEAAFNEWYDKTHIPDVLKIKGFVAATRYTVSDPQRSDAGPAHRYLTVYEVEADNLAEAYAAMAKGLKDATISPHLEMPPWSYFFTQIGERRIQAG